MLLSVCYAIQVFFSFFSCRMSDSFYYASYAVDVLISMSSTLISAFPNVQCQLIFLISNSFGKSLFSVYILFVNYLLRSSNDQQGCQLFFRSIQGSSHLLILNQRS
jgi:hypothetical protein